MTAAEQVVERAYEVFARYALPPVLEHCPHCWYPEDEAALHAPLRTIPSDRLWHFAMDATSVVGEPHDLLHFAPRVLDEVLLRGADDPEMYLRLFRHAGWAGWPAEERTVVLAALDALWETRLATWQPGSAIDDVVCGIGTVLGDLNGLLAGWAARTDRPAVAHLAELVTDNPDAVRSGAPLWNPWWEDVPEPMGQVVAWVRSPDRLRQIQGAYSGTGDEIDEALAAAELVIAG